MRPILVAMLAAILAAGAQNSEAERQLKAAINAELVNGDLKAAIQQYGQIAAKYKSDRAVVAQALLHMGQCYEKLGNTEARQAYERLVKEFGDQKDVVTTAQARLAAMGGGGGSGGMTPVSLGQAPTSSNVATDKPLVTDTDPETGDLMLRDLLTGETRNLTNNGPGEKGKVSVGTSQISADGKMVAYEWQTKAGDQVEIRSINTDGTGMRVHWTGKATSNLNPVALSPDKQTLLVSTPVGQPGSAGRHPVFQSLSLADNTLKPFAEELWGNLASFSPDGKHIALTAGHSGDSGSRLFLANADGTGVRPPLAEQVWKRPVWTPDGKWIVFVDNRTGHQALRAIPATGGEPRFLKAESDSARISLLGLTRDGSLFYGTTSPAWDIQIARLDSTTFTLSDGPRPFVNTSVGTNDGPSFSPDGKWFAWWSFGTNGGVHVRPTAGGEENILFKGGGAVTRWFPDSRALLIRRSDGGEDVLERVEIADDAITELYRGTLPPFGLSRVIAGPEGNGLLWARCDDSGAKACGLVRYDPRTKSETVEPLSDVVEVNAVASSPDGKWLAVRGRSPSASVFSLFVRPMAAGGRLVEVARGDDRTTIWGPGFAFTPDNKQLLYAVHDRDRPNKEFRVVPIEGGTPISIPLPNVQAATFHPDGRLAYTANPGVIQENWMIRDLPLK